MSRGRVLVRPQSTTTPSGDVSATDWVPVQQESQRTMTQRYDVRAFGTTDTPANTRAAFEEALAAANAAGGGVVTGPAKNYVFDKGVIHPSGVSLDMPIGTVFDFTSATPTNGYMWSGEGSYTALPALAANIPKNGRSITFASAPSVMAGDWILLYDSADYSFHSERPYYRAGEFVRVVSIAGSTVTIAEPTYAAYAAGSTVTAHKLNPAIFQISGVHFKMADQAVSGLSIKRASKVVLNSVSGEGCRHGIFGLTQCVDVTLDKLHGWSTAASVGLNYGLALGSCQDVTINDPLLASTRHGLDVSGGGAELGGIPSRNIKINGGTVSSTGEGLPGLNTHAAVEWVWFNNVTCPKGMGITCNHARVVKGKISSAGNGQALHITYHQGWDIQVDAEITATRDISTNALVYIQGLVHTVDTGTLVLEGTINVGTYRSSAATTNVIRIENAGTGAGNLDIRSTVNVDNPNFGTPVSGLYVRSQGGTKYPNVWVTGKFFGATVTIADTENAYIEGVLSRDAPGNAVSVTATYIYSRDNNVRRAGLEGLALRGAGIGVGEIHSLNDLSLDANTSGGGGSSAASILIANTGRAVYRGATVGDTRATTKQTRADYLANITTFYEGAAAILGTVTTRNKTGIGTTVPV